MKVSLGTPGRRGETNTRTQRLGEQKVGENKNTDSETHETQDQKPSGSLRLMNVSLRPPEDAETENTRTQGLENTWKATHGTQD